HPAGKRWPVTIGYVRDGESAMRLQQLKITECRSIDDGVVPLEGLTVLFGPNSGGKTTVLEAVRELLGSTGFLRQDPVDHEMRGDYTYALGVLSFELPGAHLAGTADHQVMRDLLVGMYSTDHHPFDFVDSDAHDLLVDASFDETVSYLVDSLVAQSNSG